MLLYIGIMEIATMKMKILNNFQITFENGWVAEPKSLRLRSKAPKKEMG